METEHLLWNFHILSTIIHVIFFYQEIISGDLSSLSLCSLYLSYCFPMKFQIMVSYANLNPCDWVCVLYLPLMFIPVHLGHPMHITKASSNDFTIEYGVHNSYYSYTGTDKIIRLPYCLWVLIDGRAFTLGLCFYKFTFFLRIISCSKIHASYAGM